MKEFQEKISKCSWMNKLSQKFKKPICQYTKESNTVPYAILY